jgi:hypothetical protein
LAQELGSRQGKNLNSSLTVADIYFDLLPFQTVRKELGVESLFDYERALLRLLAGQGGFLELEYIGDRHKLERQLASGVSDPDFFRELLPAGVRIRSLPEEVPPEKEANGVKPAFKECPSCAEALPRRDHIKFCPFCGDDVRRSPCVSCEEELRLNWRFCIACGTEVVQKTGRSLAH